MARRARTNPHPDLFAGAAAAARGTKPRIAPIARNRPAPDRAPARDPVWLCVHFPSLPLQVLKAQCDIDAPCVVVNDDRARTLAAVNRAAHAHSIFAGHALKHALALCSQLTIVERDRDKELAALTQVAQLLIVFSPTVSVLAPDAVLLEVRPSLKLFAGIEALCAALLAQLRDHGHHVRYSVAPSASGAAWLVRAGVFVDPVEVVSQGVHASGFQQQLHALDIEVTGWPDATLRALREMGVTRVGDCRRLPRAGLARRFGASLLQSLGQAFGELPELHTPLQPPAHFDDLLLLDTEISAAPQLAHGCCVLLSRLEQFLRAQQGAVRVLAFTFHGWREPAGQLTVALRQPGFRMAEWQRLLDAHLERCSLTQPAVSIRLQAQISEPLSAESGALDFASKQPGAHLIDNTALHALLDQFRARLGDEAVNALRHVPSRQPGQASQTSSPMVSDQPGSDLPPDWLLHDVPAGVQTLTRSQALLLQRPLWLLPAPRA